MNNGSVPIILTNPSNKVIITSSNVPNKPSPNLRLIQNSSAVPSINNLNKDHEFYKKHPKEFVIKFRNPNCEKHIDVIQFNNDASLETNLSNKEIFIQRERGEINKLNESQIYGAGTEFGKEAREEARIRRMTLLKKKAENREPISLIIGRGRNSKRYKAMRVSMLESSQYCVLLRQSADSFEAIPVKEWFKMNLEINNKFTKFEDAIEEMQKLDKNTENVNMILNKKYSTEKSTEGGLSKKMKIDYDDEFGGRIYNSKLILTNNDKEFDSDSSEDNEREILKKRKNAAILRKIKLGEERDCEESDVDDHQGDELDYMTHSSSDEEVLPDEDREKIYSVNNIDEEGATQSEEEDLNQQDADNPSNKDDEADRNHKISDHKDGDDSQPGDSDSDDSSSVSSIDESGDDSDFNQQQTQHNQQTIISRQKVSNQLSFKKSLSSLLNINSNSNSSNLGSSTAVGGGAGNNSATNPSGSNESSRTLSSHDDISGRIRSEHRAIFHEMVKYLQRKPISKSNLYKKLLSKKLFNNLFDNNQACYKLFEQLLDQLNIVTHIVNGEKLFSLAN